MGGYHHQREALLRNGTRVLSCALSATLALAYLRPSVLFTWHPACMALGYLGLMTDGILRAIEFRPLEKTERVNAIQRHAYVQVLGILAIATGFYAIYLNKVRMSTRVGLGRARERGAVTCEMGLLCAYGMPYQPFTRLVL